MRENGLDRNRQALRREIRELPRERESVCVRERESMCVRERECTRVSE